MKQKTTILASLILLISLFLYLSCCDDKPDCPTCPEPTPEEKHIFYISYPHGDSTLVKAFSADQHTYIDSFWVELERVEFMAIIGDYEKLFLAGMYGSKIINLETKAVEYATEEFGGHVELANSSEYYATARLQPSYSREIRRTIDQQVIYSDSLSVGYGHFSFDSKRYIYFHEWGPLFSYDPVNDSITTEFNLIYNGEPIYIHKIQPTKDMSKIYLIGAIDWILFLGVMEFGEDSLTILRAPLKTGGEEFALSPDGKHLFFINAPYFDHEFPSLKVEVIDVTNDQIIASISTEDYDEFDPLRMVVSCDGKYLLVSPLTWTSFDIMLIDAVNFTVIGKYKSSDQQIEPWTLCTKQ